MGVRGESKNFFQKGFAFRSAQAQPPQSAVSPEYLQ
jgi:hypothetical protein